MQTKERLFPSDSLMWEIDRERIVLIGGPCAAVLQVAHPKVAMAVAAHSNFRTDSVGRLHRTLDAVYAVAFGTIAEVETVRKRIAAAHRPVRGEGYTAFDQDAQLWVLATLIMGSVRMYQRFVRRLRVEELDQFLLENATFGEVFGLNPDLVPRRWSEFEAYWRQMIEGEELGSHPLCAAMAAAVVCPERPWYMRALSPVFRAVTILEIPEPLRARLNLDVRPWHRRFWGMLDVLVPPLRLLAPRSLRYATQYNKAL